MRAGIPLGDLSAGMYAVIGALAALERARDEGVGAYIDVSMLDCQISMLVYQAAYHLIAGEVPGPQGREHVSFPTYRAFRCADGIEIVVAANTERMWSDLCAALRRPDFPPIRASRSTRIGCATAPCSRRSGGRRRRDPVGRNCWRHSLLPRCRPVPSTLSTAP